VLTSDQKGAIAEAETAAAAIKFGIDVLKPLSDGTRYDLVFDLRPELVRVQCKSAVPRLGTQDPLLFGPTWSRWLLEEVLLVCRD
jgi:PD-(D/E)XK nuclease superfamily protein